MLSILGEARTGGRRTTAEGSNQLGRFESRLKAGWSGLASFRQITRRRRHTRLWAPWVNRGFNAAACLSFPLPGLAREAQTFALRWRVLRTVAGYVAAGVCPSAAL